LDEAAAELDRALELCPDDDAALAEHGKILHRLGKDAAALADFDRALALNPNLVDLRRYVEFLRVEEKPFEADHRLERLLLDAEELDVAPQVDEVRVERQRAVEVGEGGGVLSEAVQDLPVLRERRVVVRAELERAVELGRGLVEPVRALEQRRPLAPGVGLVRAEPQPVLERGEGAREVAPRAPRLDELPAEVRRREVDPEPL